MADSFSHTRDSISLRGAGIITVLQQKKGARFSLDSLLLADFCVVKPWDRILEPGTGTGVVSLLIAKKYRRSHIIVVEVQPALVRLCRLNIGENQLADRIDLIEQDLRALKTTLKPSTLDVIVANPPYRKTGTGRQCPGAERLTSRHDCLGDLSAWLGLERLLRNKGRYVLIFPADRLADLITALREKRLEPKVLRMVHPSVGKPASLVLMEAVKSAGAGLRVLPPLMIHEPDGEYTAAMREIYGQP